MKHLLARAGAVAFVALVAVSCVKTEDATPAAVAGRDDNLALGNLSGAVASLSSPTNYLLVKDQYTLSYNRDQGKPNWVSWHLSSAWLGSARARMIFGPIPPFLAAGTKSGPRTLGHRL